MSEDTVTECLKILEGQGRPLIQAGLYESEEDFLRHLVGDFARRKIEACQDKIGRYEGKHQSLEKFNAAIGARPTPEQEDMVWDWEAANIMLEAWQRAAGELNAIAS